MNTQKLVRWVARILALGILLFGLPFYFGYGNPLLFLNSAYTLWDTIWLCIFPLLFLGLALGWKYEKVGGYLIVVPLSFGLLFGLFFAGEFLWFMLAPFFVGILYLLSGYGVACRK